MARKGYLSQSFTLPDGTRKYIYAKTKKELEEKVLKAKIEMSYGVDLKDETLLSDLVQLWFSTDVKGKVALNTEKNLKQILNKHLMPLVTGYAVKRVTPLQVKMWINKTSQLDKHSAATCFRALKQAFNLAEENGLITKSPVLARYSAGGKPVKSRTALTPTEEAKLLQVLESDRTHLYVWFLLATGARRSEALAVRWDCVDLDAGTVHFKYNVHNITNGTAELTTTMKTVTSNRVVPLPADLCAALRRRRASSTSLFVFPGPKGGLHTRNSFEVFWGHVHTRFGPDVIQHSYPTYKTKTRVTPHVLRHTYATRCFEAGLDIKEVQYLLGHSTSDITLQIYTHYCKESRQDATFSKVREARTVTLPTEKCTTGVPQKPVICC